MITIVEHMEAVIITMIKYHGVNILTNGEDYYAVFGDRLSIPVTMTQASLLEQYNEEFA